MSEHELTKQEIIALLKICCDEMDKINKLLEDILNKGGKYG